MNRKPRALQNVVISFGGQLIIIVLGIIIPRIMIISYGSDTNGLTNTITQIFTYMALLESGIALAARNALFRPITENNKDVINKVLSTAQSYYRRITLIYGACILLLSVFLPFLLKTDVGTVTVFFVVFFEGLSGVVSFYFIQTHIAMLMADGKGYVNNAINVGNKLISYTVKIAMAYFGINIALLQVAYFVITVAKVFIYKLYFRNHYPWIKMVKVSEKEKLKDRNYYVISEVAWTIFSSTDMIVLSVFVSTKLASVYSVYNMVFSSINVMLSAVYYSLNYILGQTFHESIAKYKKTHDVFLSSFLGAMTSLMSVAYILILPFVKLYTRNISDIDYINTSLPVMFCLVQILSWSRYIAGNLIGVAGRQKESTWANIAEATMNLLLSVALVNYFGIAGVLFATVIALPLKVVYCNYVADRIIMKRSSWNTIKILMGNYAFFAVVVFASRLIQLNAISYTMFILYGVLVMLGVGILGLGINILLNPDIFQLMKKLNLKNRRHV